MKGYCPDCGKVRDFSSDRFPAMRLVTSGPWTGRRTPRLIEETVLRVVCVKCGWEMNLRPQGFD